MRSRRRSRALALALAVAVPAGARAQSRYFRLLAEPHGLPAPAVGALAQDDAGFIWLVTAGGLYRYDGVEMRRILGHTPSFIFDLAPQSRGVAARFENESVALIGDAGALPLTGPDGAPLSGVRAISRGGDGALWVAQSRRILRRAEDGWRELAVPWRAGENARFLRAAAGGVVMATERGFWRLDGATVTHLTDLPAPFAAAENPSGGWWLVTRSGSIWQWQGGTPVELHRVGGRPIAMVRRGESTWIAFAEGLVELDAKGALVAHLRRPELISGGPLLLDHEGSLWMGTLGGAMQFPDPETMTFDGWPVARFLALDGDTIWVNTWESAGSIQRGPQGWISSAEPEVRTRFCRDGQGRLWSAIPGRGIVRREAAGWRLMVAASELAGCAVDAGGGLWLSSSGKERRLWRMDPGAAALRHVESPPFANGAFGVLLVDRRDRLWVEHEERLCRASAPRLAASGSADWTCVEIPGAVTLTDLAELPSGAVWTASNRIGVWQVEPELRLLPGNEDLPSRQILGLEPSADGSLWILGHGLIQRVREDARARAGWRVEERVTAWQGAVASGGQGLVETPDGALWIATARGVTRIPRSAREARPVPPAVELVEAHAASKPLPLNGSARLAFADRSVSLRFAALSFRDPALLRYQVRLAGQPWPAPAAHATLEFPRLDPGTYRVEARASLDGANWSAPASYAFAIAPPWYRAPWALALWAAAAMALLWAAHRTRVGVLLALERQRTRVAMDLHDEMGSGLGSIGILSNLIARQTLESDEQRRLAREIAATSQELGGALSDIVWALRRDDATLESLAARLAESGSRLFAGDATSFASRFPEVWPALRLPLQVRRNVLLAGLEALHNASRHARAGRVELSLRGTDGIWELTVEDDGIGLPADAGPLTGGMGLRSIRRRAVEIGGEVEWQRPPAGGTRLILRFPLRPPRRLGRTGGPSGRLP